MIVRAFVQGKRFLHFYPRSVVLCARLALTPSQQERGLMFLETLDDNDGMLFEYKQPGELSFWMKNTLIPLSIAFIDYNDEQSGTIIDIQDMEPKSSQLHKAPSAVQAALEVNRGWFEKHNIQVGDQVEVRFGDTVWNNS